MQTIIKLLLAILDEIRAFMYDLMGPPETWELDWEKEKNER